MWIKPDGFYSKFKYVEVARYVPELKRVIREQSSSRVPTILEWPQVAQYSESHDRVGIYTSVFNYDTKDLDQATRFGPLYFDLDSPDLEQALSDARLLVGHLQLFIPSSAIRVYFTGAKGFHVECEPVALGIAPSNDLPKIFRFIANDLKEQLPLSTLDFAVYDLRRMWRLPNSRHQSTGLWKVPIDPGNLLSLSVADVQQYAGQPRVLDTPDQEFNFQANQWYREYTYEVEASKQRKFTTEDIVKRFAEHGSGHLSNAEYEREFDPIHLFKGCPAIMELWKKAEEKHHLEHSERLFLCSILTYTDEAIEYLHSILSNCHDYNFEKSQSHIDDWIRRREMGIGGRPFTCNKARDMGISCAGCSEMEPKPKYESISGKLYPTGEFSDPSPIRFAYSRKA